MIYLPLLCTNITKQSNTHPDKWVEFPAPILIDPPRPLEPVPTARVILPPVPEEYEIPEKIRMEPVLLKLLSEVRNTTDPLNSVAEEPDEMYYRTEKKK